MESARCRAFVAAADTGSFTSAGKMLDYTPSGVSQLVRALENELGLVLLSRRNRGVSLTREGEKIYPKMVEYIAREESLMEIAEGISNLVTGEIVIASFTSIAANYLPSILRDFDELHPNVSLKITEANKYRIEELLNNNEADIAFCSEPDYISCDFLPLMEDRMVAVLPGDHRYAKADTFPIEECRYENMIMPAKGRDPDVIKMLKDNGVEYEIKYTTMEDYTAARMVEAGLGICITNELAITKTRNAGYVVIPVEPATMISYGITLPSIDSAPPAVKKFMDFAIRRMTQTEGKHI